MYKLANKEAKRALSNAKYKAYDTPYTKLGSKEREKDICKLDKARERKMRELGSVRCVKNEDNKVLVRDDEIKEKWK